jgi:hypothetical protein
MNLTERASRNASSGENDIAPPSGTRQGEARTRTTAGDTIRQHFGAARRAVTQPDDEPEPDEAKKRRGDGDGDFQKLVMIFGRHLKARRLKRFRTAARKGFRFVRIIRLSRAEWGAPDAHLQTTLNLFDQPGSHAVPCAGNSHAVRSHYHAPENNLSARL